MGLVVSDPGATGVHSQARIGLPMGVLGFDMMTLESRSEPEKATPIRYQAVAKISANRTDFELAA